VGADGVLAGARCGDLGLVGEGQGADVGERAGGLRVGESG
jgi:hypothetical protein